MFIKSKVSKSALAAVFAGVAMFSTQSANAIDSTVPLNVSATVQSACTFGSLATPDVTYDLNFGTFTVGATGPGSDKSASVAIAVECAANTSYSIGANGTVGSRKMTGPPGAPFLKYELYSDGAFTIPLGNIGTAGVISSGGATTGTTHTIHGLIPQAGNTTVTPGGYSDVVILTLRF
jgi:spore coat protein U-like protein